MSARLIPASLRHSVCDHAVLHDFAENGTILQENVHAHCMQEMNSGSPIIPKVYNVEHIVILHDKCTARRSSRNSPRCVRPLAQLLAELQALQETRRGT